MAPARNTHLNQALMRIPRRSESVDRHTLARTFVGAGSLSALLHSTDHQILYGRRGTGKTHALLYLGDLVDRTGDVAVYLDLRTIGSAGGLYADPNVSQAHRGTILLVDTLEAIHDQLLALAVERAVPNQDALLRALDALAEAATSIEVIGEVERETTVGGAAESTRTTDGSASLGFGGVHVNIRAAAAERAAMTAESRSRRTGVERHHVVFGPLNRALRAVVDSLAPARIWLLLDEWSSIPLDLQPLLADLLRRSVLPTPGITVKIAAIERRSRFRHVRDSGEYVGIEVGADAASAVSLDDFLIFDNVQNRAADFFSKLFYNHTSTRLPANTQAQLTTPEAFIQSAFKKGGFAELVRATEGVPRDAINIAALAAQQARAESIGILDVRRAARDWYLRDKQTAITANDSARQLLRKLVDEVVGRRQSRTFLLDQLAASMQEGIYELYDARLLHVLRRGILDRKNPGTQYDGFAIDYGCYVALLLDGSFQLRARSRELWLNAPEGVPLDNFSMERSVLDPGTLAS